MTQHQHVHSEDYLQVRQGLLPRHSLPLRIHDHLLSVCARCASVVRQVGGGDALRDLVERTAASAAPAAATPPPPEAVPDHHLSCFSPEARRDARAVARLRTLRRRARKETWTLQNTPPGERLDKIRRAFSQFRSRATAEYLLHRCREIIPDDPAEGGDLAALVPCVLHWTPGAEDASWARDLAARAVAWRANALRAAGDLDGAERAFAQLRRNLALEPVEHRAAQSELYRLEAALRIDQERMEEADELLELATLLARAGGDEEGLARTWILRADLLAARGRLDHALCLYRDAARQLEDHPPTDPLPLAAVVGQIHLLCDLGRSADAARLLQGHLDVFEEWEAVHSGALLRHLQGRVALARGAAGGEASCGDPAAGDRTRADPSRADLATAEAHLRSARDAYLAVGHPRAAAHAALDLATLFLHTGHPDPLREPLAPFLPPGPRSALPARLLAALTRLAADPDLLPALHDTLSRPPLRP